MIIVRPGSTGLFLLDLIMIWKWIQKTNYNEAFIFEGTRNDLNEILATIKSARIQIVDDDVIRILANVSTGTAGFPFPSINISMLVSDHRPGELRINLLTTTRLEQFGILAAFILALIGAVVDRQPWWLILFILCLWPFSHWWFHIFHRAQEND